MHHGNGPPLSLDELPKQRRWLQTCIQEQSARRSRAIAMRASSDGGRGGEAKATFITTKITITIARTVLSFELFILQSQIYLLIYQKTFA